MFIKISLLLLFISTNIFAQAISNSDPDLSGIKREKSEALNSNWEVVPSLKSIHPKKFKGNISEIHHKNSDRVFFKRQRNLNKPLLQIDSEDESQVIYNPSRGQVGHMSGAIIINLVSAVDFNSLLKDYPIKKIRFIEKLASGIVRVKAGYDLAKVVKDLRADKRIKNVEVEITSNRIMPL